MKKGAGVPCESQWCARALSHHTCQAHYFWVIIVSAYFGCRFPVSRTASVQKGNISSVKVLIIEPNREMQRLLRAMLTNYGIRDVQVFSDSERASSAMLTDAPDIVLADWETKPYDGPSFLKLVRHKNMYPMCLIPIIVMFAEPRQLHIERAMKLGAHAVVAKPMAPALLHERISWVLRGSQKLKLVGERYVVDGMRERLVVEQERQNQLEDARAYQQRQFTEMKSIQSDVDKLLEVGF